MKKATMTKEFCNFVGIDVSKNTLDVCVIADNANTHQQYSNDEQGIKKMLSDVKQRKGSGICNTLFCFEHTGVYGRKLALTLTKKQCSVWIVMPVAILRSIGLQRGKNDKVDARRIASYAMKHHQEAHLWEQPRKEVETLRQLLGTRERMLNSLNSLRTPINELKQTGNKDLAAVILQASKTAIKGLEKGIAQIDRQMDAVIAKDAALSTLYELITSIPGIGKITATELICFTNEFKLYKEAKQLACYCGVAPFEHSSGSSVRGKTRVSHMANKSLKCKLHLCAMSAIQYDTELKTYYQRKVAEGKNKMLVINAVRNKLVHRITAVVKRQTPFKYKNAA